MRPTTDFVLVADAEIERMADLAAKHAKERTLMAGRHENERRELARLQQQETIAAMQPPAAAPAEDKAG